MEAGRFEVQSLGRRSLPVIARALRTTPGLTVLTGRFEDEWGASFVGAFPDAQSSALVPPLGRGERPSGWNGHAPAPAWVGQVPYEALRAIERAGIDLRPGAALHAPCWNRYPAMIRIDTRSGHASIEGTEGAVRRLARALARGAAESELRFAFAPCDDRDGARHHLAAIHSALELIARGDVYQVNLARQLRFSFAGDPLDAFLALCKMSPSEYHLYGSAGEYVISAHSPELALARSHDLVLTRPMKGTRPRGQTAVEDQAASDELSRDPKEVAELTMAVDLHRNDLGRVAVPGTVRVRGGFRTQRSPTLWSRYAEVAATLKASASLGEVFAAVLPCGSVTGAPKVRAMQIIAALEPQRRGLYTGAYGALSSDGARVALAVAIRTLVISGTSATYGSGGGIVADSRPQQELEETYWKAQAIQNLASSQNARYRMGTVEVRHDRLDRSPV
jgi:anthranilate/para-aminobenzoate synthase component I